MITTNGTVLSHRDHAVLKAVAAGRCEIAAGVGAWLVIDGLACCDQLVGPRLIRAGLIEAGVGGSRSGPARLTASGQALIEAA
ncbi:MAG: hypothetical protein ACRDQ5_14145 [Sciscionella sp.]